jgi:tetratricopeptide (TPR) repeat protein
VTAEQLDTEAWAGLRSLPKELAIVVARHLVMAGRLLDEDPEQAYLHTKTARRLGSRVAIVREGCGIAAYQTGHWSEALAELRAARRLSGKEAYLPVMADCERGLGRPERALSLARSAEAERLHQADRVEMRVVESGARRDMGQYDAAVLALQIPELKEQRLRPWSARLLYAYADALSAAGREDEASEWFARAAAADRDGDTDAAERYAELEGLEILDVEEDFLRELGEEADGQPAAAAPADDALADETHEADMVVPPDSAGSEISQRGTIMSPEPVKETGVAERFGDEHVVPDDSGEAVVEPSEPGALAGSEPAERSREDDVAPSDSEGSVPEISESEAIASPEPAAESGAAEGAELEGLPAETSEPGAVADPEPAEGAAAAEGLGDVFSSDPDGPATEAPHREAGEGGEGVEDR